MAAITISEYQELVFGAVEYLANTVIRGVTGMNSEIETRYITSEGTDDESWLGFLRKQNSTDVDIWLVTLQNTSSANIREGVGHINKPLSLVVDYFTHYRFGRDVTATETNTEREFHKKVLALDLTFELKRSCLNSDDFPDVEIEGWTFKTGIKRFATDSCHFLHGDVRLKFNEIRII